MVPDTHVRKDSVLRVADNRLQYFAATTNGIGAYYNYSGSGAMFYSANQAGVAAGVAAYNTGAKDRREYAANIYVDNQGVYSYSPLQQGPICVPPTPCKWTPDSS